MTIYQIKRLTAESSPYFFTRETLRFFGQTLKSFSVRKMLNGCYHISAPMKDREGNCVGATQRIFNPETNTLEQIK